MRSHTEQDYGRRIARVIAAMARDPAAPHSIESLAAVARFSPFHFHRLYRSMTGEGVGATLRRLRLARAAQHLTCLSSVTDAALDAGYDTPQGFARAFRAWTGLSPTDFRTRHQQFASGAPAVTIVDRDPASLVGVMHDGPAATIPHSYAGLRRWAEDMGLAWSAVTRIGSATGDPEGAGRFTYFAGLVPPDSVRGDGRLSPHVVPGGRYAAHRLLGPYTLIGPTVQALLGQWLPRSGLEPDDRPMLEIYHAPMPSPAQPVTDLLIPIREPLL